MLTPEYLNDIEVYLYSKMDAKTVGFIKEFSSCCTEGEGYYVSCELPGYWNTGMLSGLFDRDRDIRSGISHASRGRINISSNIIYNVGQRKNNCW